MATDLSPVYPVYVPSKGRSDRFLSGKTFARDGVPFRVVVEPTEVGSYAAVVGEENVLSLPESGRGLVYSRNWIKDHSISEGHERHWQFDDDIRRFWRMHLGRRLPCSASVAIAAAEDFTDRYSNVALTSFNSSFFVTVTKGTCRQKWAPFYRNSRCYTCFLVNNDLPNRWRFRYNEDTDMSLQVLADGWCTVLLNAFLTETPTTMTAGGGQMVDAYQGDGRLRMARDLERVWPGVVSVRRRFKRPTHAIRGDWTMFDTSLVRSDRAPRDRIQGLKLVKVRNVENERLRRIAEETS